MGLFPTAPTIGLLDTLPQNRDSPTTNTSTRAPAAYRVAPWRLSLTDISLILRNLRYAPDIVWPFIPASRNPKSELYFGWNHPCSALTNVYNVISQLVLFFVGLALLAWVPAIVVLPGGAWLAGVGTFVVVTTLLAWPLNGGSLDRNPQSCGSYYDARIAGEKWFFVNGVSVGSWWLQCAIDESERHFKRRVIGIRNETFGLFFDLAQCIIQRCFGYSSADVRNCYTQIREALLAEEECSGAAGHQHQWTNKRVVVLAHSQGGLILSLALDMIFADLSADVCSRLEIYTFGNAANHFNNPPNSFALGMTGFQHRTPTIKYLEHFANQYDFVSRYGVLAWIPGAASDSRSWGMLTAHMCVARPGVDDGHAVEVNQFAGKVFEHFGVGGHMFVDHYFDNWLFKEDKAEDVGKRVIVPGKLGVMAKGKSNGAVDAEVDGVDKGAEKKSMLQLSRLYQYKDGAQPRD